LKGAVRKPPAHPLLFRGPTRLFTSNSDGNIAQIQRKSNGAFGGNSG
jgi:hypothetical protein